VPGVVPEIKAHDHWFAFVNKLERQVQVAFEVVESTTLMMISQSSNEFERGLVRPWKMPPANKAPANRSARTRRLVFEPAYFNAHRGARVVGRNHGNAGNAGKNKALAYVGVSYEGNFFMGARFAFSAVTACRGSTMIRWAMA